MPRSSAQRSCFELFASVVGLSANERKFLKNDGFVSLERVHMPGKLIGVRCRKIQFVFFGRLELSKSDINEQRVAVFQLVECKGRDVGSSAFAKRFEWRACERSATDPATSA